MSFVVPRVHKWLDAWVTPQFERSAKLQERKTGVQALSALPLDHGPHRKPAGECHECLFKNTLLVPNKNHHHCKESNWDKVLRRGRRGLGSACTVSRTASAIGSTDTNVESNV